MKTYNKNSTFPLSGSNFYKPLKGKKLNVRSILFSLILISLIPIRSYSKVCHFDALGYLHTGISGPMCPITFSPFATHGGLTIQADKYTYTWNFGDPGSTDNVISGNLVSNPIIALGNVTHTFNSPGTYFVSFTLSTYSNGQGGPIHCNTMNYYQAIVIPDPCANFDLGNDIEICAGDAYPSINAGAGWTSYQWSGPGGFTSSSPSITPYLPGKYVVNVFDQCGYSCADQITIIEHALPLNYAGADQLVCGIGTVQIGTGFSTPGYTYSWSPTTGLSNSTTHSPLVFNSTITTTYTLTITDQATGCSKSDDVTVFVENIPTITATSTGGPISNCSGSIQGSISLTASGAGPGGSYTWSPSTGLNTSSGGTVFASPATSTTYTVTGTTALGCFASNTVTVQVAQSSPISLTVSTTDASCSGINNGQASVSISGGVAPYSYAWNGTSQTSSSVTGLAIGSHSVTVTDANGCSQTANFNINSSFTLTLPTPTVMVYGGSPFIAYANATGGSSSYSYEWFDPNGDPVYTGNPIYYATSQFTFLKLVVTDLITGCSLSTDLQIESKDCDAPDEVHNYTISDGSTTTWDTPKKVLQNVIVKAQSTLVIKNTEVLFDECTKLIIEDGGHLEIYSSLLTSCTKWYGIEVRGDASDPDRSPNNIHGGIYMEKSEISNADIAILLGERNDASGTYNAQSSGGLLEVSQNNRFIYNGVHIAALDYPHNHQAIVDSDNEFFILKDNTTDDLCFNESTTLQIVSDNYREHIYLDGIRGMEIKENYFFDHSTYYLPLYKHAINMMNCGTPFVIGSNQFSMKTETSIIKSVSSNEIHTTYNQFTGSTAEIAIDCYDSDQWLIENNNISGIAQILNGIQLTRCEWGYILDNYIEATSKGIQFYPQSNQLHPTIISGNSINNCFEGLVISEFGTDPNNLPQYNWTINVKIHCNSFDGNQKAAILGSGNLIDQGNVQVAAGNSFGLTNQNTSGDIFWYPGSNWTYYYENSTIGHQPMIYSPIVTVIHGVGLTSGNFNNNGIVDINLCGAIFKMTNTGKEDKASAIDIQAYPNPTHDQINITGENIDQIQVVNLLGQVVLNSSQTTNTSVNLEGLPTGIYILRIFKTNGDTHMIEVVKE